MSRTVKGSKPPGYEFWSKRPGNFARGRWGKLFTHRIERRRGKHACQQVDLVDVIVSEEMR